MTDDRHHGGNPVFAVGRYVYTHWCGQQGLAWSFWVNLIGLRAVVFAAQSVLLPEDHGLGPGWVVAAIVLVHGVLFLWQAVGVVRASETHLRAGGAMQPVWGVQLALIVVFLWVVFYAFTAWPRGLAAHDAVPGHLSDDAARGKGYAIIPMLDGRTLAFDGVLELGVTAAFEAALAAHPETRRIVLTSTGGNIYAARGLARAIRTQELDTEVTTHCASACTIAFIGGVERHLAPGARLGFHQYRIDAAYPVLTSDPAREEARDRAIFLDAGVAPWFVARMFDTAATGMWYPDAGLLRAAGVVTSAAPGGR